jgi:hypothetical protein
MWGDRERREIASYAHCGRSQKKTKKTSASLSLSLSLSLSRTFCVLCLVSCSLSIYLSPFQSAAASDWANALDPSHPLALVAFYTRTLPLHYRIQSDGGGSFGRHSPSTETTIGAAPRFEAHFSKVETAQSARQCTGRLSAPPGPAAPTERRPPVRRRLVAVEMHCLDTLWANGRLSSHAGAKRGSAGDSALRPRRKQGVTRHGFASCGGNVDSSEKKGACPAALWVKNRLTYLSPNLTGSQPQDNN